MPRPCSLAQAVRLLLLSALTFLLVAYVSTCVAKHRLLRKSVSVEDRPEAAFHFPAVELCLTLPITLSFAVLADQAPKVSLAHHLTLEDGRGFTMVASSYPSDEDRLPPNVTSGQLWGESVRNFDSTSDIVCTLYKPPPFKTSSKSFGMYMTIPSYYPHYVHVYINEADLLNPVGFFDRQFFSITGVSDTNLVRYYQVQFRIGERLSVNSEDRQCMSDEEVDSLKEKKQSVNFMRCIHDYLTKKVPCYGHDSRQFYLNCSQEEQQATLEAFKHLTDNGEGKSDLEIIRPEDAAFKAGGYVRLFMTAPEFFKTIKTEFFAYDGWSLAGDIGGMVGMLLGMSILALYDKFSSLAHFLWRALFTNREKHKQ